MRKLLILLAVAGVLLVGSPSGSTAAETPVSDATAECLACHAVVHPGIVEDWKRSRHAVTTPQAAMAVKGLARKLSAADVPQELQGQVVGCAECHTLRSDKHADTFDHNGYNVHVVVSPDDCATCHSEERAQYADNLMANAHKNLAGNAVYRQLQTSVIGRTLRKGHRLQTAAADSLTEADACYYCHGTRLAVKGSEIRDTELAGELKFPVIDGWPNQGVGRINLDGSMGACTACHARHQFSLELARGPYTCKECHVGPDVPAFPVYEASKHGNIHASLKSGWNFDAVPWTVGVDFSAPTCAACHISLLVDPEGEVLATRSHRINNRLPWRIYGLIYAHPHPISPDTTIIRNKDGLPLPTDLDGGFASKFLIDTDEMQRRTAAMQKVCSGCHDTSWVSAHWKKLENSIDQTNVEIRIATDIIRDVWKEGYADGLDRGQNPFDEAVEKYWHLCWLFYANSIRFTSAMAGGGDYGVFAGGRYQLSLSIAELNDWYNLRRKLEPKQ
jgi:hydroxylamine dehydrogenase